jgi:hypothetical protein
VSSTRQPECSTGLGSRDGSSSVAETQTKACYAIETGSRAGYRELEPGRRVTRETGCITRALAGAGRQRRLCTRFRVGVGLAVAVDTLLGGSS